jgi:hypothetical protein
MEMKEQNGNDLWEVIVSELKNQKDISTVKLSGEDGKWFSAMAEDGKIKIANSIEMQPSSDITTPRYITKNELLSLYPDYPKWRSGEKKRPEIRDKNSNSSYIFGLIHHFSK